MTITTNLNLILGGIQIAQIPGTSAVEVMNLIYDHRQLAFTEQAYQHLSGLRPLSQALNMHMTPGAPRMKAPGETTGMLFTPNIALSAFHIVSEMINLLQAELRLVAPALATGDSLLSHDEKQVVVEDEPEGDGLSLEQVTLLEEIEAQLSEEQQYQLHEHFSDPEDEEEDDLAMHLVECYGWQAVLDQIKAFGFEFVTELDEEDEEEEDFEDGEEEEFGGGQPVLPDYAVTVMRQDLIALGEPVAVELARSMGHPLDRTYEQLIDGLMADPVDLSDECAHLGYKLPNFAAVAGALEEDDEREDRLGLLDLHDLEMLCDALRIDHDELSSDEMIEALCNKSPTEFVAALRMINLELPDMDEDDQDHEGIDAHRERFQQIAGLTMMQSALAACIAQAGDAGGQDLILSFTN
ncbi:hypothetical protein D3C85_372930 [compost metagenome]